MNEQLDSAEEEQEEIVTLDYGFKALEENAQIVDALHCVGIAPGISMILGEAQKLLDCASVVSEILYADVLCAERASLEGLKYEPLDDYKRDVLQVGVMTMIWRGARQISAFADHVKKNEERRRAT